MSRKRPTCISSCRDHSNIPALEICSYILVSASPCAHRCRTRHPKQGLIVNYLIRVCRQILSIESLPFLQEKIHSISANASRFTRVVSVDGSVTECVHDGFPNSSVPIRAVMPPADNRTVPMMWSWVIAVGDSNPQENSIETAEISLCHTCDDCFFLSRRFLKP
jgi:hypothetical protein